MVVEPRIYQQCLLLNGPGFNHLKMPFDGIAACMPLPNQYDNTSKNNVDTLKVCGLK